MQIRSYNSKGIKNLALAALAVLVFVSPIFSLGIVRSQSLFPITAPITSPVTPPFSSPTPTPVTPPVVIYPTPTATPVATASALPTVSPTIVPTPVTPPTQPTPTATPKPIVTELLRNGDFNETTSVRRFRLPQYWTYNNPTNSDGVYCIFGWFLRNCYFKETSNGSTKTLSQEVYFNGQTNANLTLKVTGLLMPQSKNNPLYIQLDFMDDRGRVVSSVRRTYMGKSFVFINDEFKNINNFVYNYKKIRISIVNTRSSGEVYLDQVSLKANIPAPAPRLPNPTFRPNPTPYPRYPYPTYSGRPMPL